MWAPFKIFARLDLRGADGPGRELVGRKPLKRRTAPEEVWNFRRMTYDVHGAAMTDARDVKTQV